MAPAPGEKPKSSSSPSPRRAGSCFGRALKVFLLLGVVLTGAGGYGAWWTWRYVQNDLSPLVETALGNLLQRPVELGELGTVTPNSITFGPSQIPATADDPDTITTEGVLVKFSVAELLATRGKLGLNVILQKPDLYLEQTADGLWTNTTFKTEPSNSPLKIALDQLKLDQGNIVAVPYGKSGLRNDAPIEIENVKGKLKSRRKGELLAFEIKGNVVGQPDANVNTKGEVDLSENAEPSSSPGNTSSDDRATQPSSGPEIAVNINGKDLQVSDVKRLLESTVPLPESEFDQGLLDGNIKLAFLPNQDPYVSGEIDFRDVTVRVPQLPQPVNSIKGKLTLDGDDLKLKTATGRYGPFDIQSQGDIHLKNGFNLTAEVQPFELPDAIAYLDITLPTTVSGRAKVKDVVVTGPLELPFAVGQLETISQVLVDDTVPFKSASSRFTFENAVIGLQEMRALPESGGLITGSGEIVLSGKNSETGSINIDSNADGLSGNDLINLYNQSDLPFRVGPLNVQTRVAGPLTEPVTTLRFQALQGDYPFRGLATIANGKMDVEDVLIRVAGGVARGGGELVEDATGNLFGGNLRGRVQLAGVQLNQFSDELRGDLGGDFTFSGPFQGLGPETIQAEGITTFSQGISIINDPITARVSWERDKIRVGRATAAGFESDGLVFTSLEGTPEITGFDLNVQAQDQDLATLPATLGIDLNQFPVAVALSGVGDFRGKLTGTTEVPEVQGNIALRQFQLNNLPFESSLDGSIAFGAQGTDLQLAGQQDSIAVNLDPEFEPRNFLVSQGDSVVKGEQIGPDQLQVTLEEFSLAILDFKPAQNITAIGDTSLDGIASGEVVISLEPLTADGELVVDMPSLGTLRGDRFSGEFSLRDNVAVLQNAALVQGPSRYEVTGRTTLSDDPQFDMRIAINNGDTSNLLQTLQWFDFDDLSRGLAAPNYGSLADLQVTPVGLPNAPLITQLQRFSEIETLVRRETLRRREEERIPALGTLAGQFNGGVNVSGSLSQGLKADFNVLGEDWRWGNYDIDRVILRGEFADDVITFQPVRVEAKDTVISLTGQFGGDIQQSGQLRAENVPVTVARNFIELPVSLTGDIDMEATVAGTAANPQAIGRINLENGTINGTPVRTKQTGFNYVNARLGFGGALEVDGPEPVRLSGSVPYAFPFSEVQPENDELRVNLSVKNEGLAFLDLITRNQIKWLDGKGEVQLNVGGTLSEPEVKGLASFENASLAAQFLPDAPLTEVSGRMRFAGDRIFVDGVQGLFSDGAVIAQGIIPISRPDRQIEQPLKVSFTNLDLNLRGLYRGGASGDVLVTGSSLSPELGGKILLEDGQVLLPDSSVAEATAPTPGGDGITVGSGTIALAPPSFENLLLRLGQGVKVQQVPLFSFSAEGDLLLLGNLEDPRLKGTIALTRGQVNLFTSQFSLETRAENIAEFDPDEGLDPRLQLTMATAVTEASRRRSAFDSTSTSEIQESGVSDFGSLQTVRIRASIEGPASQLLDNITLSSSPSRSQAEIASLIGGGFVDTLGRGGDSTLALANLAGSALLGNLQGAINNALRGPVELRLFPTIVESTSDRRERAGSGSSNSNDNDDTSTVFALGAEVGVNINNSTSFSALRLLTVDLPTQYNLRYQLNENLTLRGTTDLEGDNRFVVDYEARF